MVYYCPVGTCGSDLFRNNLIANLWNLSNEELIRRLETRSKKMLWWSTWILGIIEDVKQLERNYWMTVPMSQIEEIYRDLSPLVDQQMSPLLLIVEVVGGQLERREPEALLRLVSSPEIARSLILDQKYADRIINDFDVELMKSP